MFPSGGPVIAPLGFKSLKHCYPSRKTELHGLEGGHYQVLQKLVSSSPNALLDDDEDDAAEIETCLEQFVESSTGSVLWRRVVVRSGPSCPQQVTHASYMLPEDCATNSFPVHPGGTGVSVLCWTAFPDRPQRQMLCVLANPTLLCIWDVYSGGQRDDIGVEGHTIPLPFEACGIHAVDANFGLLLQRAETVEDMHAFDYQNGNGNGEDDDDGFVLKAPPRPVRLRESTGGNTFASLNVSTSLGTAGTGGVSSSTIPSLFSLSHPLDDILPVSTFSEGDLLAAVATDVFEKILFVGVVRWVDEDEDLALLEKKQLSQPVCVTYHSQLKRHAIWEIKHAPPPPPLAPLWQISSQWRSKNAWDSHLGVLQNDLEDFELVGSMDLDSSHYDSESRKDALADALGVRRTPKNAPSSDTVGPRTRSIVGSGLPTRTKGKNSMSVTLLSPLSRANESHSMDIDASGAGEQRSMLQMMGPFGSLHPKTTFSCIYCETELSPAAENIFLASNDIGAGNLSLCLVCPKTNSDNEDLLSNSKVMRLLSFNPRRQIPIEQNKSTIAEALERQFTVRVGGTISCTAAQPIQASSTPKNCEPNIRNNKDGSFESLATDILLLRKDAETQKVRLALYRNGQYIVECAPKGHEAGTGEGIEITDLHSCVGNVVSISCVDPRMKSYDVRGSLSLKSSSLGELVLQCVEAAFVKCGLSILALKVRADCKRLEDVATSQSPSRCPALSKEVSIGAEAAKKVILALFLWEILSLDVNGVGEAEQVEGFQQSSWRRLQESNYHDWFSVECQEFLTVAKAARVSANTFLSLRYFADLSILHSLSVKWVQDSETNITQTMFDALHFLYEELKLHNSLRRDGVAYVGSILTEACRMAYQNPAVPSQIPELYLKHYTNDMDNASELNLRNSAFQSYSNGQNRNTKLSLFHSPPCILSWLEGIFGEKPVASVYNDFHYSNFNAACSRTRSFLRIHSFLRANESKPLRQRDFALVDLLIEEGFRDQTMLREELPLGICLPFLEVLHRCRIEEVEDYTMIKDGAWVLIGRDDLYKSLIQASSCSYFVSPDQSVAGGSLERKNDKDGVSQLEVTSSMLFPDDNRLREVGRLLRSSRPIYLHVARAIEVSDHDYEKKKQEKLLLSSRRTLALPIGRGMLTMGNLKPVPAEPLPVPELCLAGRVPPTDATLALDTSDCPVDLKVWPEFHNGVAAGLRLPQNDKGGRSVSTITRTWIVYNRPNNSTSGESQSSSGSPESQTQGLSHAHGGLLMALGLRGHLTALEMTDIFDYLTQGTVTTTVGVLLGMAANMRGTCDIQVSKMLCLHIPSLIPQHFSTIDVASTVQAAAVAGAGLLYEGSCHRMMTEFLLNEIGKRPSSDGNILDREAYTLACGVALGMVNLCKGGNNSSDSGAGLEDLRIEERLYRYVVGGLDDEEMRRRREESDRLGVPSTSAMGNNERCSCIYEGESINTDVTAPGATLALGLMYMRSGNKTIASTISLPDTHFLLEYVRPDFLMLRVIARALILWDEVEPTRQWVEAQLPKAVHLAYEEMRELAETMTNQEIDPTARRIDKEYDRQAVRLIYTHVIAAACFSIGLRFAGTGDSDAVSAIYERVVELLELRDASSPSSSALRPPSPVLEMCLGCASISLSMVLAGTGDLNALRLLKVLRWPCTEEINYGSHLAFGTAIGLLFLGGGTCTLGRDPKDIAALIMAFSPRFPSSTSDNQYHLQALRNLYALAVKHREIRAVDVSTGESVFVPIEVHFQSKATKARSLTTPCLLLNTDMKPCELRVVSKEYFPQTVNLDVLDGMKVFFVKRRSSYLCQEHDPHSQRSSSSQNVLFQGKHPLHEIRSFTDDPLILSFAKHLCDDCPPTNRKDVSGHFALSEFFRRALRQCFMTDKQEALPLYLTLRSAISVLHGGSCPPVTIAWDFRLVRSLYQASRNDCSGKIAASGTQSKRLLNCELVAYLIELLESKLVSEDLRHCFMSVYYDGSSSSIEGQIDPEYSDNMDLS